MSDTSMRDNIREKLWSVVEDAVLAGVSPKDFRYEVRECWDQALEDARKDARKVFDREVNQW